MILITIDQHPLRSDPFDKFIAGMAIEGECRMAIRRADYAYRSAMPACAERAAIALSVSQERPRDRRIPSRGPSDDQVSLLINMQREGEIAFQLRDIAQAQFLRRSVLLESRTYEA